MKTLSKTELKASRIETLIAPMMLRPLPDGAYEQLARYVRLLVRWNARMNLTAVREPETFVSLHVAECLRCAQLIPETVSTVLDFGSGAGLPGIPIQVARPELNVTLAESQAKKAGFLREAVRELELSRTSVYLGRVEDLPADQTFDLVALRAVDQMQRALRTADFRIQAEKLCMVLTSEMQMDAVTKALPNFQWQMEALPGTQHRVILVGIKKA